MQKLDAINQALIRCGQIVVTTTEQTKASRIMHEQFRHALKSTLCAHPWDQFKKYKTLSPEDSHTDFTSSVWQYAFKLPIDFCRVIDEFPAGMQYDRIRGLLLSNNSTFDLIYVAYPYSGDWDEVEDIDTVTNWSELPKDSVIFDSIFTEDQFEEALYLKMIETSIYSITGDHNDTTLYGQKFATALVAAKSVSAQQKPNMHLEATGWCDSRW